MSVAWARVSAWPTWTLVTLLLTAASVRARPEQPALHWVRGAQAMSCIEPQQLAQRVQSITGPTLVSAAQASVSIEARIEHPAEHAYEVHMRVTPAGGASQGESVLGFDADDCRSLDAAIAFVIAMAIDPQLGSEGIPMELGWVDEQDPSATAESLLRDLPAKPGPPAAPAQAPGPRDAHAAPAELRRPTQATAGHWRLTLAAAGGNGPASRAAAGLVLDLSRAILARFCVAAQVSAATDIRPRRLEEGRSVLTRRLDVALLACLELPVVHALDLRGCLGPRAGAVLARGSGFTSNRSSWLGGFGAASRLDLRLALGGRWGLVASGMLDIDAVAARIHHEVGAAEIVAFRTPRFYLQGALGITYSF